MSRFVDPTEADINDYDIEIKDQTGEIIITDSVINVDHINNTITYVNEKTDSGDYYNM